MNDMEAELKSLMIDCKKWLNEFKKLENKAAHKERYAQYIEIMRICKVYFEEKKMPVSSESEKEELLPHFDSVFFRCIHLIKKFTLTVEGDTGFEFRKNDSVVGDANTYTYVMEGYDKAEYDESDRVSICKKYGVFETETTTRELELTILFETEDQVFPETKKIVIPAFTSTYEITVNAKWLPKLKVDASDPMAVYQLRNDYDTLSDKTMMNLINTLENHLVIFKRNILSVTKSYTVAYENYTNTLKSAKDIEELRAEWVANAWSIAGGGILSWLSSTNQVLGVIKKITSIKEKAKLDQIENVLEDITQTVLDKAATTGSTASAISDFQLDSPLSFQNNLEEKGIVILQETLNTIKAFYSIAEGKKSDLNEKGKAHKVIDIEKEWEVFQKVYSIFLDIEATLTQLWSKQFQISSSLTNNLELLLWAKWISIQKTQKKVRTLRGGGKGGWYEPVGLPLENPIIERFSNLGLLKRLGIDLVTLEWSWDDEYEVLRNWAKGFKPKQLF